jgi:hypothetical protein
LEHRETYTPAPVTVAGITIEVDVALSVSLWHLEPSLGGKRPVGRVSAGSVSAEPVTIRITTGDNTVSVSLSEFTAGETRSIIEAD